MTWFVPTSQAAALLAQRRLLKHFVRHDHEVKTSHGINYVVVKGNLHVKPYDADTEKVLVLMHGYGLGLGLFYENINYLAPHFDRIIAVDWPGMGCSSRNNASLIPSRLSLAATSCFLLFIKNIGRTTANLLRRVTGRPPCSHTAPEPGHNSWLDGSQAMHSYAETNQHTASYVGNIFIDKLEAIREKEGVKSFVLAGHSLGGFLSAKYALKYPQAVSNLILISPVGVSPAPTPENRVEGKQLDWRVRTLAALWRMNVTPQAVVRLLGARGPEMMTDVINRRFSQRWSGRELELISDYIYHISAAPGSGEYALSALLEPVFVRGDGDEGGDQSDHRSQSGQSRLQSGVYAFQPVEQDLQQLKVPLLLVYGDNDWLRYPGAEQSVEMWRSAGVRAQLVIVPSAGHHLYLDNHQHFNRVVKEWVEES